jgi:ribosomal protein S3AE
MADDTKQDKHDNKQAAKNAAKSSAELKKQKKKKWCPIITPEAFGSRVIGESLLDDASQLMKRTVTVNMMQLSGDMKKQNLNIMFKVVDVKDGKGFTEAVRFEMSPSSVKRLAKRERDKISDSFVVKTADEKLVRIKPLLITNNLTKGSVAAALVKNCRAAVKEKINRTMLDQLIIEMVDYKFQKEMRDTMHTTYPLRTFEVRMLSIETKKKKETVEEELIQKLKKQQEQKEAEQKEQQEEQEQEATSTNSEDSRQDGNDSEDVDVDYNDVGSSEEDNSENTDNSEDASSDDSEDDS